MLVDTNELWMRVHAYSLGERGERDVNLRVKRDVARGVASYSPHQLNKAQVYDVMRAHCARLSVSRWDDRAR